MGTPAYGDGETRPGGGRCSWSAYGGPQSPRPGHTSLRGRRVPPRWSSMLMKGLRGAAVPQSPAHHRRGTESPAQAVVGAQGGSSGGSSPRGPGTPAWGDGESRPGGGPCSRRVLGGQQSPRPGHTGLGGRRVLVVGAQGGPTGGSTPQGPGTPVWGDGDSCPSGGRCSRRAYGGQRSPRPGHTSLGGRGVLPKRWSLLKEGLRGSVVPKARAH